MRRSLLPGVLALGLVLAACGADDPTGGVNLDDGPSIDIVKPPVRAEVELPFELEIAVSGVEVGPSASGRDHLHVYVGDAEFDPHYSTDPYEVRDAEPGEQTIRIELARPNHDEVGVAAEVTVIVTGGPGAEDPDPGRDY